MQRDAVHPIHTADHRGRRAALEDSQHVALIRPRQIHGSIVGDRHHARVFQVAREHIGGEAGRQMQRCQLLGSRAPALGIEGKANDLLAGGTDRLARLS